LQPLKHPFKPIIDKNSKILILGTFPSIKSFENFYYGHPKNQFWKILASVYEENIPLIPNRKRHLTKGNKNCLG
jgi:hypoxanthine-DNA glycosylase